MIKEKMSEEKAKQMQALVLAMIGDSVQTLFVREYVAKTYGVKVNKMNKIVTSVVKAGAQFNTFKKIESELTVYMLSANAIAATGEIVNIDGTGNRVANAIYGPQKVYYVCGENEVTPDLMSAIDRARNMAAPPNAKRLGLNTPCAIDGKCHNCASENRICNAMSIILARTTKQQKGEVFIIGEKLGY